MKKVMLLSLTVILFVGMSLVSCAEPETTPPAETDTTPETSPSTGTTDNATTLQPVIMQDIAQVVEVLEVPGPDPEGIFGGRLHLVGSMNIANIGDPNQISNPGDSAYTMVACESLLRYDAEGNLSPWLARKYEIAADGSSITFYLREGIKFQDGTPFNAEAVKYNIDIQIKTTAWSDMKPVDNCEVIDEYTVRLNFKDGKLNWPAVKSLAGAFSCLMYSPAYLADNTPEYKRTHVVGTGPFKLVDFKRDEYVKFDRFDDYWRGRPFLDGIDYKIIPNENTQLMAFRSGEIDTLVVNPKDRETLEADGFEVVEMPVIWVNPLCLIPSSNNPDSPLADIKVRQACEHAIDKQGLLDTLGYGLGKTCNQIFVEEDPCYNPDVVGYSYDPEKARQLLKEAGYEDGFQTKFIQVDFLSMDFPLAIQDMWREVGIETEIIRVSILQINDMVAGHGWEGWFYAYAASGPGIDPANALLYGPINYNTTWISNWEPPELIELAKAGAAEIDPENRVKIYQEISKKMIDDYAQWLFLYYPISLTSVSPRVKGASYLEGSQFAYAFAWVED